MPNRINYQLEMEKALQQLGDTKPTLLLLKPEARGRSFSSSGSSSE